MASIKKSVRLHSSKLKNSKSTLSNGVLNKDNKNNTTNTKNNEKGLGIKKPVATNRNSLAYKMPNKPAKNEFLQLPIRIFPVF